ncbi:MAG: hypothetical protein Q619_VDC00562G0001, partial [Veillonella dispar DORA_11]
DILSNVFPYDDDSALYGLGFQFP